MALAGGGRRAARAGCTVFREGRRVGTITSGLLSPTLGHPIALALLEHAGDEVGWDDTWRARLRTARSHPVPAVAAWAREIRVESW